MATPASDTSRTLQPETSRSSSIDPTLPIRGPEHISDEEGPWAQKTVLTFDGGGVRGYASLLILKRIMTQIRILELGHTDYSAPSSSFYPWMGATENGSDQANPDSERVDEYLPCHYFDYIAGTSTGGLSSIMLGRLRMSVDQAMDAYKDFGNAVFGKPRWFHERSILYYPRAKFSCRKTREAFQMVVLQSLQRERGCFPSEVESELLKYREDRTRTIAVSWAINKEGGVSKQYVWRSYDNNFIPKAHDSNSWKPYNPGPADTAAIWEVARATTAAPRYFESIKIRGKKFLDGGMVANNPSLLAIREINNLHDKATVLFVSIGTGLKSTSAKGGNGHKESRRSNDDPLKTLRRATTKDNVRRKQFLKKYIEIGRHWKNWMVDCEGDNGTNGWRAHCKAIGLTQHLYRLNVEGDLHTVPLDDWRPSNTGEDTLESIRTKTEEYLREAKVIEYINLIANEAVRIRRLRAATEQWERFGVDVLYCCPSCDKKQYDTRAKLREHLEKGKEHKGFQGVEQRGLEEILNVARTLKRKKPTAATGTGT
ncbi:Calcium-independent phospholipase A2-gamma [Fusarium austroafricanum]|uniref:Calcium-independent phospholipase A2-gamma n=1 Tax=Fusarium austroafricanum TaxID=2364996 RepID=A0A8H4KXT7_9HYPO|nr:Calcium-independent phospholipase A2-gamma [Fusarium austroafricanum]